MLEARKQTAAPHDHLAHVFAQYPIEIVRAEDVWLTTSDGRRILDLYGGHAVAALGYGHPRWIAALEQQARTVLFQSNAVPMDVRTRAARKLIEFADLGMNGLRPKTLFMMAGTKALRNLPIHNWIVSRSDYLNGPRQGGHFMQPIRAHRAILTFKGWPDAGEMVEHSVRELTRQMPWTTATVWDLDGFWQLDSVRPQILVQHGKFSEWNGPATSS